MPTVAEAAAAITAQRPRTEQHRDRVRAFRASMAWRRTRYRVLAENAARNGGRPRCEICGRGVDDGVKLHVDHVRPLSDPGNWQYRMDLAYLRVACADCNIGRLDKPIAGL